MAIHRRTLDKFLSRDIERRKQLMYPSNIMMPKYGPFRTKHAECAQLSLELLVPFLVSGIRLQRIITDKGYTAGL